MFGFNNVDPSITVWSPRIMCFYFSFRHYLTREPLIALCYLLSNHQYFIYLLILVYRIAYHINVPWPQYQALSKPTT